MFNRIIYKVWYERLDKMLDNMFTKKIWICKLFIKILS